MIDMDTTRLERFAKYARRYLMEQVGSKLQQVLAPDSDARRYYPKQIQAIEEEIQRTSSLTPNTQHLTPKTYHLSPLAEQVAYTWFNRFCALRFMDVNGYNKVNVISPLPGHFQPEILEEAKAGHIDETLVHEKYRTQVFDLLSGKETHPDPQSEAYRILIRSVCNYYADTMPFLFERIDDWTELMMPDDLLSGNSILAYTREAMVPGVCKDVEVIGWLYQYYIAEKKSEVQEGVKKGKKVQSKDIPAVTQLFTPHWIVKYMVQNSLGRLWLDTHPNSALKAKMEYFVAQDADPAKHDIPQDRHPALQIKSPEEIKFCDPCCGSGHVLTYAFDLLYEIYSEEGYSPTEIPRLIIEKNLYGIEIDERAAELSALALTMKAREKDKLWFSRKIEPHICCLKNIILSKDEIESYLDRCGRDLFAMNFERMLTQFEHADTYGSLIVPHEQDIESIRELLNAKDFSGDVFLAPTHKKVLKLMNQADYLSTKYQVVVTNPPYMGKGMSDQLSTYLSDNYKDVKSDLFAAFVFRCSVLAMENALIGIMSPNVWMYLSSYEKLRKWMITNKSLTNLVELPLSGFTGATVQICAYNFINYPNKDQYGAFVRLVGCKGADAEMAVLTKQAIVDNECGWFYRSKSSNFTKIPGAPIAYWASSSMFEIYANSIIMDDIAHSMQGMITGNNDKYLRLWYEVSMINLAIGFRDIEDIDTSAAYWIPYNKGGGLRKWYGNNEYLLNWSNKGNDLVRSRTMNAQYYLKPCITWTFVSSVYFASRFCPPGFLWDVAGSSLFPDKDEDLKLLTALMCSKSTKVILDILNPTINYQVENIISLPIHNSLNKESIKKEITDLASVLVVLAESDWDSFETSWDFQQLPLLGVRCQGLGVREAYAKLREHWMISTLRMQELEEENNRIFLEAYGLQDELSPEVPLKEITLTCNPYYRYGVNPEVLGFSELGVREFPINEELEIRLLADTMKELLSYSVGCMFGRYSLDKPGLILANQGEGLDDYVVKVLGVSELGVRGEVLCVRGSADLKPNPYKLTPSFLPDKDNVIPILEGEWFDDDIVNRFHTFIKVAFGADHFSQNLSFIEEAIGKDIRTYFIKDFYNDHVKMYKKRPIYWLFSSPKGSFNALVYMHRYTPDTASIVLSDYLREYVFKLKNKATELSKKKDSEDVTQKEKILAGKELDKIEQIISELEYWERDALYPTATQKISIDLDDGVKVNYAKFSKVLKRIPGLE